MPPDEGNMIVNFLFDKLKEAIGNPMLRTQIEGQLQALQFLPHVDERFLRDSLVGSPKEETL